jgi:sugar (pentulose or hexulose) kinase
MIKPIPVILIFDVGKTNKKIVLFNEQYKIEYEENTRLEEIKDEDGFPCEDVVALTEWIIDRASSISKNEAFEIKAINFTAYGASFVYLDKDLKIVAPLYNYLKAYPESLQKKFYDTYGGTEAFSKVTASPILGNLNSGMQLYRLKYQSPELFARIIYALHLPQYLSFVLTRQLKSDITSIGCHTNLWNFQLNNYHDWVYKENIKHLLPEIDSADSISGYWNKLIPVGAGLHESSAALIPYLNSFTEPFIVLSTGTWCITLNPFNDTLLTSEELKQDCLCYLSYNGKPVKASRLFSGHKHEQLVKKLSDYYNKPFNFYEQVELNQSYLNDFVSETNFNEDDLEKYADYAEAYHYLVAHIVKEQVKSTSLVLKETSVKCIFVDGGFSKNPIYMYLLARAFPSMDVYAASVPHATALGAALVMHRHWNNNPVPADLIQMKPYSENVT